MFIIRKRLFIPKATAAKVDHLIDRIRETVSEFDHMHREEDRGITNRPWRGWDELWTQIRDRSR